MRYRILLALLCCSAAVLAFAPSNHRAPAATAMVVIGTSPAVAARIADSVWWYSGYRPDSVVVQRKTVRLAMPASAFGQGITMDDDGCHPAMAPMGALDRTARQAISDLGGEADTVVINIAQSTVTRGFWPMAKACSAGSSTMRVFPDSVPRGA